ncbi:MAG: rRNA maturation RNase YbeY [Clostridiales bacterium]|jgi:probable rRNA maturation factor|nr:rRNA maturation RNase YbeY [Clostridiales bacterium]
MLFIEETGQTSIDLPRLKSLGEAALLLADKRGDFSVSLNFVTAARIRALNKRFRGIDCETDVLSFPMLDLKPSDALKPLDAGSARGTGIGRGAAGGMDFSLERDGDGNVFLGDVVLCSDVAKRQAVEYGHSEQRETEYLFIHALLHLFGFDHAGDADKRDMRGVEKKVFGEE